METTLSIWGSRPRIGVSGALGKTHFHCSVQAMGVLEAVQLGLLSV